MLDGLVPQPIGNPAHRQTRRWSKAVVDRKLGIKQDEAQLRRIVAEELLRLVKAIS